VKSVAGYDGRPQSASVKIVHTKTGQLLAGANWQNGRGGAQGSPADQGARVDLVVAAQQIANAIYVKSGKDITTANRLSYRKKQSHLLLQVPVPRY